MDLINLKRIFNHVLLNVPEEKLKMRHYRSENDFSNHECGSTGCVIGHSVILDDLGNIPLNIKGHIFFTKWSVEFTKLKYLSDNWLWCFSSYWPDVKEQILLRIKYLIDNQEIPGNWNYNADYILPSKKLEPYEFN